MVFTLVNEVMLEIWNHNALQPRDLAKALNVTTACLTSVVDRLAAKGLISRTAHATDRRSYWIELTHLGDKRVATISADQ